MIGFGGVYYFGIGALEIWVFEARVTVSMEFQGAEGCKSGMHRFECLTFG